jgi:hypothetical protein
LLELFRRGKETKTKVRSSFIGQTEEKNKKKQANLVQKLTSQRKNSAI